MSILSNDHFEKKTFKEIYNLLTNEKISNDFNNHNSFTHSKKKNNNNDSSKKIKFKKNFINLSEFTLNNDFPNKKLNFNDDSNQNNNNLIDIDIEKFKNDLNEIFKKEIKNKIKPKFSNEWIENIKN